MFRHLEQFRHLRHLEIQRQKSLIGQGAAIFIAKDMYTVEWKERSDVGIRRFHWDPLPSLGIKVFLAAKKVLNDSDTFPVFLVGSGPWRQAIPALQPRPRPAWTPARLSLLPSQLQVCAAILISPFLVPCQLESSSPVSVQSLPKLSLTFPSPGVAVSLPQAGRFPQCRGVCPVHF